MAVGNAHGLDVVRSTSRSAALPRLFESDRPMADDHLKNLCQNLYSQQPIAPLKRPATLKPLLAMKDSMTLR